jgi:hypothetical protein
MKQLQLPAVLFDNRNQIRFRDVGLSKRSAHATPYYFPSTVGTYITKLTAGGRSIVLRDIPVEQGELDGVDNKD